MKRNNAEYEFLSLLGKFFTVYLPISINASQNTISSYKCAFRLLFQYLDEVAEIKTSHITFEMLGFDLLTDFFDWLVTIRKNSRTTAKQRMGALASFAEYAQCRNFDAGCVFRSSLARIAKKSFRRVKGKQRSSFTRVELEILFSLPDTADKLGWRDLVLLSVMYSSGARAQEICNLCVKDVMHDEKGNAILVFTGKGEKSRRVKITADATQLLDKYIAYRKIHNQPTRHIFPSQRNESLFPPAPVKDVMDDEQRKHPCPYPFMGGVTPEMVTHQN